MGQVFEVLAAGDDDVEGDASIRQAPRSGSVNIPEGQRTSTLLDGFVQELAVLRWVNGGVIWRERVAEGFAVTHREERAGVARFAILPNENFAGSLKLKGRFDANGGITCLLDKADFARSSCGIVISSEQF